MNYKQDHERKKQRRVFYKKSGLYFIAVICLFILIGFLTTAKPAYRVSSNMITEWTSDIGGEVFLNLIGMENRLFLHSFPDEAELPGLSSVFFQLATSIKPNDPRSLLGNEMPGFSIYDNQILIAGEGTDYTNLPVESSAPLEEVLEEREAVMEEEADQEESDQKEEDGEDKSGPDTEGRKVVYLYNAHTRESFLPHLPDVDDPDLAHHSEVNITKVSDRLASQLESNGIGSQVESEDIGKLLDDRGMEYWASYDVAREVAQEALGSNDDIQYLIDIHRDSLGKDATTKEVNGESHARILFVVGEDHGDYEKNLEVATELHYLLEESYPGLSRGVITKGGAGSDGVYNQDLAENALLVEFGGVDNNFDELFRSADAFAEVFSEFYWSDAEEVKG